MNTFQKYTTVLFLGVLSFAAQNGITAQTKGSMRVISVEPCIGISHMPIMDMTFSNIVQSGIPKYVSAFSHSSFTGNNLLLWEFNYATSTIHPTVSHNPGPGWSLYNKRECHTLAMLGGITYETGRNLLSSLKPGRVEFHVIRWSPDLDFMYSQRQGQKKYFLGYRMYLPLITYPLLTRELTATNANVTKVSIEVGMGVRLQSPVLTVGSDPPSGWFNELKRKQRKIVRKAVKSWIKITQLVWHGRYNQRQRFH